MKKLILGGVALCGLAAAGWYVFGPGSDMSGTYIGKNDHQAFLVQIVQANGGQLSGFLEEADLTPDGQVEQDNVQLSGARDGKTFTVTITPSGLAKLFVQPMGLSGAYTGASISLVGQSGDFNLNLNLLKGDAQTYQGYVGALDKQAEAIQVQKATAMAKGLTPKQIQTLIASGQEAEALQALKGILMLHPTSGVAWYLAAEAEDASDNESTAAQALSKANQYAPGLPFADPRKAAALRAHIGNAGCCAGP